MKDKEAAVCMKYMYVAPNYKYFKKNTTRMKGSLATLWITEKLCVGSSPTKLLRIVLFNQPQMSSSASNSLNR